jgi:hypothetical protein
MAAPIRLSEFLPYVMPQAPGCPSLVAESYLRMAAIEFCERTKCWRKISEIEIDDERTVAVVAPYYAAIHQIEFASFSSASHPKSPLTPTQYSDIGERFRADMEEQAGPPRYITQVTPNTVTVFPLDAGTLEVSLFLKPRMGQDFAPGDNDDPIQDTFNVVPDFLLTQWGEPIACGALSKLLLQPQTQWYDPNRAAYYLSKFERACDRHFAQGLKGQQRAPHRTRYRFL